MEREPVQSSTIQAIGYDPAAQVLEIEFQSGRVYQYRDVPPAVAATLRAAPSAGAYFSRHVRNNYECWRLVRLAPSADTAKEAALPNGRQHGDTETRSL